MSPAPHRFARALLPGLIAALLAGPALAEGETSPWYIGTSAALTHVSNIYRLSDADRLVDQPNSDDVATVSLLAGLDKPLGRQRLYGDAAVRRNLYRRDQSLNNTGYTLNGGLDWAALDKLAGSLTLRSSRNLAQYNPSTEVAQITSKNIEQSDQAQFTARYGLAGRLTLEGGLGYQRRDYSADAYQVLDFHQHSAFTGLSWRFSGALNAGATLRHTEGQGYARVFLFVLPNDYRRNDLELSSTWTPSAASSLNARLSYTKISNSNSGVADFSGVTGRIGWAWQPTAKLQINTALVRDTAQERVASATVSGRGNEANRVSDSLQLGMNYALTPKLLVDAGYSSSWLRRGGTSSGDDHDQSLSLGLRWLPTRHSQLGCQITRDQRSSDIATLNYSANSFGCYGQLTLR